MDPAPSPSAYAELQARSCFSFLRGASQPAELVERAAELGYRALAITDDGSVAGIVRAHLAARERGLPLIVGASLELEDGPPLVLHATDRASYGRLTRLLSRGRRRTEKGRYLLRRDDVLEHAEGLLAAVAPGIGPYPEAAALGPLREAFGERASLGLTLLRRADDAERLEAARARAAASGLPLVALGGVTLHAPERQRLQDVLTCVRAGATLEEACERGLLDPNAERHLRSREELARVYRGAEDALERTVDLAERCAFSLDALRYEYPHELAPPGTTPMEHLAALTWAGAEERYAEGIPERVRTLLARELRLIEELAYEPFFLTVHEVVRFARDRGILVQGRGSAANSAVCFCLGVTAVDPQRFDVLFERFVSRARGEPPDIDLDIEHERREEVIQHVYERYGHGRAALAAEVICYRERSAPREVAKVFDLGEPPIEGDDPRSRLARDVARELQGLPRHLSQHVGGMVITRGPLAELVPIENAAMPERTVVEWDKDDLEALGILKVDLLGLGMLTCVRKAFDLIEAACGPRLELATVPPEDPAVYDMLGRADTVGVFQIESRAQMNMLPRLAPRCFFDLVIEVAIVRPGPIQGGMVHPYLRRRQGEEPVEPISPAADRVLAPTLGVPIFQEQVMRLAIEVAGFSPDEAESLRKAMGAFRRTGTVGRFQARFVEGAVARGVAPEVAERLFTQSLGFGEYGFPQSHAASFARLTYVSSWIKRYYPAAFTAALLNSQPMGFYAPAQLIRDARAHGVPVLPVDVEASGWDARLEWATPRGAVDRRQGPCQPGPAPAAAPPDAWGAPGPALRLGLREVRGLAEPAARRVEAARRAGPFGTVARLARRARLPREPLERLAEADALRSLAASSAAGGATPAAPPDAEGERSAGDAATAAPADAERGRDAPAGAKHAGGEATARPRREAHFDALAPGWQDLPLFRQADPDEEPVALPPLSEAGEVLADYAATGLSLRRHPLAFARPALTERGANPLEVLERAADGERVAIAGLVTSRQRPATAGGVVFLTLEDETGTANLIVQPRAVERFARLVAGGRCLLARGRVEREGRVVHVLVRRLEDAADLLPGLSTRSRDFR